ncbi:class III extradiol ring-cleavage dioxygenase [Rhodoferax sp.]|uniref:DODA-type extradiol aromatic ring-opening family dioxygenase n=1 Tax=Rhodoferax sp. TaxID=50421 RepID=UPI0025CBDB1C|nr:class III extradiol ring-cleavage dioxygenase [Rhodoferax sp.]
MMTTRMPTYFISHGGGPWPWMDDMRSMLATLEQSLADMPAQIGRTPKAILMVTAHWEERAFTLGSNPAPGMVYDYGGFPAHTYSVVYPAPGAPELAARVQGLLEAAGLPVALDAQRGYDHGTFVPLAVMYPEARVPVLQMSLRAGLDPAEHIALGRALAPLRDEEVLIVGSGLSYHNLRNFGRQAQQPSQAFDGWLQSAMQAAPDARAQALVQWESAPSARLCHPREEHLLPLMVAVGAGYDDAATCVYHDAHVFGGVTASSFCFGDMATRT